MHLKHQKILATILLIFSMIFSSQAKAEEQIKIVIDQGISAATPIAIADFKFEGVKTPIQFKEVIGNDLLYSGRFRPVYNNAFPESIDKPINLNKWTNLGISNILVGNIKQQDNHYVINYQLLDLIASQSPTVVIDKSITIDLNNQRLAAHLISDEVFQFLTGLRGVANTLISYVTEPVLGVEKYQLVISDYDGFNPKIVFTSDRPIISPAWSPDASKIAFVNYQNNKASIYQYNLANGVVSKLIGGTGNDDNYYGSPSYDPSGAYLTYTKSNGPILDIYRYDLSIKSSIRLTNGGNNTEAKWSNNRIVFTSDRSGNPDVYIMDYDGANVSKIATAAGRNYDGALTPDGNNIVYINNDRIVRQSLATGSSVNITNSFLDESISLSPNGLIILYSSKNNRSKILNLVSIDGRFKATLPIKSGQISEPAWSSYVNSY